MVVFNICVYNYVSNNFCVCVCVFNVCGQFNVCLMCVGNFMCVQKSESLNDFVCVCELLNLCLCDYMGDFVCTCVGEGDFIL